MQQKNQAVVLAVLGFCDKSQMGGRHKTNGHVSAGCFPSYIQQKPKFVFPLFCPSSVPGTRTTMDILLFFGLIFLGVIAILIFVGIVMLMTPIIHREN